MCTTVQQQYSYVPQYSRKYKEKKQTGGFELTYSRKKKKKSRDRGIWTDALSRIERSTAEPKGNVVISCRLREGNFEKSSLAESGCDARSFAGDREGYCVGGTWRGGAVSGDRVALATRSCFGGI